MNLKNCQNPFSFNSGKSPYQNNYHDFAILAKLKLRNFMNGGKYSRLKNWVENDKKLNL